MASRGTSLCHTSCYAGRRWGKVQVESWSSTVVVSIPMKSKIGGDDSATASDGTLSPCWGPRRLEDAVHALGGKLARQGSQNESS